MIAHQYTTPKRPSRVVVVGSQGFLGAELCRYLTEQNINMLPLSSKDIDLDVPESAAQLKNLVHDGDTIVFLAALTPDKGRDVGTLMKNLRMVENFCGATADKEDLHMIYFSSDAVYSMDEVLVTERTPAAPQDLYGAMHRTRELMVQSAFPDNLCILRPTLIYGKNDTHGSYGPNRFWRQAASNGEIAIFGEGEETRDHISVGDVMKIVLEVIRYRSCGLLNLATGQSNSFRRIADLVAQECNGDITIKSLLRSGAITHRSFDIGEIRKAFPGLLFLDVESGMRAYQKA